MGAWYVSDKRTMTDSYKQLAQYSHFNRLTFDLTFL
ncbi:hypothetical protein M2387_000246 [Klebsiella sp. BIGb0407]|nr:hypothetical protein [Klebsiella sp. BIGb0407]